MFVVERGVLSRKLIGQIEWVLKYVYTIFVVELSEI